MRSPIEFPFAVERREQIGMVADALRGRQEQHPARLKRVVERRDQPVLQLPAPDRSSGCGN